MIAANFFISQTICYRVFVHLRKLVELVGSKNYLFKVVARLDYHRFVRIFETFGALFCQKKYSNTKDKNKKQYYWNTNTFLASTKTHENNNLKF